MTTVLLIVQLLISIVLIGLILVQRSEGGALGIGGGGGGGGLMSGRSSANAVTKATTYLGAFFLLNSIALSVFYGLDHQNTSRTADDPTEQGLNIGDESPNSDTPLADEIQVTDPDAETAGVTPDTEEPAPETEASSDSADETETPQ